MDHKPTSNIAPIISSVFSFIGAALALLLFTPAYQIIHSSSSGFGDAIMLIIILPLFFIGDVISFVLSLIGFIISLVKINKEEEGRRTRIILTCLNLVFLVLSVGIFLFLFFG